MEKTRWEGRTLEKMTYIGSLHNHTDYSNLRIRDCINKVPELIQTAIELGHQLVAITDHETLASFVKVEECYENVKKDHPDFKVIRGNEIYLTRNGLSAENFNADRDKYFHFILLCRDLEGYHQMCQLSTRAWNRSYFARSMRRVPTYYQDLKDIIKPNKGHIIALSACLGGQLDTFLLQYAKTKDKEVYDTAKHWCEYIQDIFGKENFYLELQPSHNEEQVIVNKLLLQISQELSIPYVITNDAHYLRPKDALVHEAFLKAQDGDREVQSFYSSTYLMNDDEVRSYLPYMTEDELQSAYHTIAEIGKKCEDFTIKKPLEIPSLQWRDFPHYTESAREYYYEKMPSLRKFASSPHLPDRMLVDATITGIKEKPDLQNDEAYEALEECLDITWVSSEVNNARWSAYYLNLQKIIDECWKAGTIIGCSRGSGGGFVLLYALDIIQMNKLRETTRLFPWRLGYRSLLNKFHERLASGVR